MRTLNINSNNINKIVEETWTHRLHLKDVFKNFQDEKINLNQAKSLIVTRIKKFIESNEINDNAKLALQGLINVLKSEDDVYKIDDLINNLYDIADEHSILVK